MIIAFVSSSGQLDTASVVQFFQDSINWGIAAATQYLAIFAGLSLVFMLFKR